MTALLKMSISYIERPQCCFASLDFEPAYKKLGFTDTKSCIFNTSEIRFPKVKLLDPKDHIPFAICLMYLPGGRKTVHCRYQLFKHLLANDFSFAHKNLRSRRVYDRSSLCC